MSRNLIPVSGHYKKRLAHGMIFENLSTCKIRRNLHFKIPVDLDAARVDRIIVLEVAFLVLGEIMDAKTN